VLATSRAVTVGMARADYTLSSMLGREVMGSLFGDY
jgi:hypothetical protein